MVIIWLMMVNNVIWLVVDLPLWKIYEFVNWDDEIPNIWKNKIHVPNHQPDYGRLVDMSIVFYS